MLQTGTIADMQSDVLDALQGRTDVPASMVANYVAKTVRELTESYPFEELRTTGPQVVLTINQAIYPYVTFLNTGDDYTSNESFAIYVDYPNNTVPGPIIYKTPAAIETMIGPATLGIPSRWTRYGTNIHLGPVPNAAYTVFMRYQVAHPFTVPVPQITDAIFVPKTWYDIVAYGAAMRICVPKRWPDQYQFLHDMLYGDPEYIKSDGKRGRPGLIAARVFQVERDQKFSTRQLMPVVSRYTAR